MIIIDKLVNYKRNHLLNYKTVGKYRIFIPDEYFEYGYEPKNSILIFKKFFINMTDAGVGNIYDKKDYRKVCKK